MNKDNKYYIIIEKLIKQHPKYPGYEAILEDIIDDVYSHSEIILNSIDNESVIESYLEKVISTSIITVPKKMHFNNKTNHRIITINPILQEKKQSFIQESSVSNNIPSLNNIDNQDDTLSQESTSEEDISFELNEKELLIEDSTPEDYDILLSTEESVTEKANPEFVDKMINSISSEALTESLTNSEEEPLNINTRDDTTAQKVDGTDDLNELEVYNAESDNEDSEDDIFEMLEEVDDVDTIAETKNDISAATDEIIDESEITSEIDAMEIDSDSELPEKENENEIEALELNNDNFDMSENEEDEELFTETQDKLQLSQEDEIYEQAKEALSVSQDNTSGLSLADDNEEIIDEQQEYSINDNEEEAEEAEGAKEVEEEEKEEAILNSDTQEELIVEEDINEMSLEDDSERQTHNDVQNFDGIEEIVDNKLDEYSEEEVIEIEEEVEEEDNLIPDTFDEEFSISEDIETEADEDTTEDILSIDSLDNTEVLEEVSELNDETDMELEADENNFEPNSEDLDKNTDGLEFENNDDSFLPDGEIQLITPAFLEENNELDMVEDASDDLQLDLPENVQEYSEEGLDIIEPDAEGFLLEEATEEEEDKYSDQSDVVEEYEFRAMDYSAFNYSPEEIKQNVNSELLTDKLIQLSNEKPDLNVLTIFELKYKQNKTIENIAIELGINSDDVVEALNNIVELV